MSETLSPGAAGIATALGILRQRFGDRLQTVGPGGLHEALEELLTDSEVREACATDSYSEDALAAGQPALMRMIQHELSRSDSGQATISDQARTSLSQALLLELMVLSEAVAEGAPRVSRSPSP